MVPPMKYPLCALALLMAGFSFARSEEIVTEEVRFRPSKVMSKAYLAMPKSPGPHPGVLVLHEWWGHNEYVRMRAEMLAKLGYAALAMDMYGAGKKAHDPQTAAFFDSQVRRSEEEMNARFLASLKFFRARPEVDAERIGVSGFPWGGLPHSTGLRWMNG